MFENRPISSSNGGNISKVKPYKYKTAKPSLCDLIFLILRERVRIYPIAPNKDSVP